MKLIPISVGAGITGFESPAAEYSQLSLSLDDLLVEYYRRKTFSIIGLELIGFCWLITKRPLTKGYTAKG